MECAAAGAGLELLVGLSPTIHNPLRVQELHDATGSRVVDDEPKMRQLLGPIDVRVWAYDDDLVRDRPLFS